jgi:hypothetical protein
MRWQEHEHVARGCELHHVAGRAVGGGLCSALFFFALTMDSATTVLMEAGLMGHK